VCPLRVFWVYNKVGDSGDVVIQEQGFSIFGTHEPEIAMLLLPSFYTMDPYPHRNQIFLVGRHQEVPRFVSPGLHHITSVSHCEMSRNEKHTSTVVRLLHMSPMRILCLPRAFRKVIYWDHISGRPGNGGEVKMVLEYGGEI
jgi:hypothetical protein